MTERLLGCFGGVAVVSGCGEFFGVGGGGSGFTTCFAFKRLFPWRNCRCVVWGGRSKGAVITGAKTIFLVDR